MVILLFSCSNDSSSPDTITTPFQAEPEQTPPVSLPPESLPPIVPDITPGPVTPDEDTVPIDPIEAQIADIITSMTLYEKVCQLLIVSLDCISGLDKYPVGGIIHYSPNIISSEQITLLNLFLRESSKLPLFLAVDEEGGRVARLGRNLNAHAVKDMLSYESDGVEKAYENAAVISNTLIEHGFNTNFAPVADVWSNPANNVIGNRAYSSDFNLAADLVASAVRGYNENNIICTLKHFPGHGNTFEDSHYNTAYVDKTLDELRENEFLPFIAGIAAGAEMIMTGHLIVPDIDDLPATLSSILLTDILRNELGFDGIIITDALAMNAISKHYDVSFTAVTAIKAGVDILLMPVDVEETVTAIINAVLNGEIPESRVDESVSRILRLKMSWFHLF